MPSTLVQKGLLALSIFLVLAGIGLTIGGAFSPAWQVVDIREFRAEHQVCLHLNFEIFSRRSSFSMAFGGIVYEPSGTSLLLAISTTRARFIVQVYFFVFLVQKTYNSKMNRSGFLFCFFWRL